MSPKFNQQLIEKLHQRQLEQLDPETRAAETPKNTFDISNDDSREKIIELKEKLYQLQADNEELRKQLERYKKRNARGAGRKMICSNEQIKDILTKHADGISMSKIAIELGCSTATISRVIKAHTSV